MGKVYDITEAEDMQRELEEAAHAIMVLRQNREHVGKIIEERIATIKDRILFQGGIEDIYSRGARVELENLLHEMKSKELIP